MVGPAAFLSLTVKHALSVAQNCNKMVQLRDPNFLDCQDRDQFSASPAGTIGCDRGGGPARGTLTAERIGQRLFRAPMAFLWNSRRRGALLKLTDFLLTTVIHAQIDQVRTRDEPPSSAIGNVRR